MKKSLKLLAALFVAAALFAGCDNGSSVPPSIPGFVYLAGATVTASVGDPSAFTNASTNPVTVAAFYIAQTELTYAEWYAVYQWATSGDRGTSKYTFVNAGREGNDGTDGAAPTPGNREPVTCVSWWDARVWCNAASEWAGLTPVYLTSETDRTPVRESTLGTTFVYDESANGYRLPTHVEWEFAARGGNPGAPAWNYKYAGTNDDNQLGDYAWYKGNSGGRTHNVREKKPNSAGLYDMSGNVRELCFLAAPQVGLGGSWNDDADDYCYLAYSIGSAPNNCIGFRLARNAL